MTCANRTRLFGFPRPRFTCSLSRRGSAGQHLRVNSWNRRNGVQPCLTPKGAKHENERVQRRSIATFKVSQRAHADAGAGGNGSLVEVLVHSQRLQVIPDFGFQLLGCPSPPGAVWKLHMVAPYDLKCACNNRQYFAQYWAKRAQAEQFCCLLVEAYNCIRHVEGDRRSYRSSNMIAIAPARIEASTATVPPSQIATRSTFFCEEAKRRRDSPSRR